MSEFSGSTLYAPEIASSIAIEPEAQHLREQPPTQTLDAVDTMSESHPDINIDVEQFSAGALIKVCPHYAKMAEINPELAKAQATEVVQRMQEREIMQEKGVDAATIKQRQFAAMRERLQAKAKAKEKVASETTAQEPETKPVQPSTLEKRIEAEATPQSVENKPQLTQKTEIVTEPEEVTSQTTDMRLQPIPNAKIVSANNAVSDTKIAPRVNTPESVPQQAKAEKVADVIPTYKPVVIERIDVRAVETMPTEPAIEQPDMAVESPVLRSTEAPFSPEEGIIAQVAHEKVRVDQPDEILPGTASIPLENYESDYEFEATAEAEHVAAIETLWLETAAAEKSPFDELEPSVEIADAPRKQLEIYEPVPELTHAVEAAESANAAILPEVERPETHTLAKVPEMYAPDRTVEPEQTAWDDIAEKEAPEVYKDFAEALRVVTAIPEQVIGLETTTDIDEPVILAESIHEQEARSVTTTIIAERLTNLVPEEREVLTPLLKKIVETVRTFESQAIETTQAGLTELVVALFEELDIAYESEDIKYFIATLLHPDFQPMQPEESASINLELQGTHEAKSSLAQFVGGNLTDIQDTGRRLLGKLVLFSHHTVPEFELAA